MFNQYAQDLDPAGSSERVATNLKLLATHHIKGMIALLIACVDDTPPIDGVFLCGFRPGGASLMMPFQIDFCRLRRLLVLLPLQCFEISLDYPRVPDLSQLRSCHGVRKKPALPPMGQELGTLKGLPPVIPTWSSLCLLKTVLRARTPSSS
ncbi:hypothetical protein M427DRAFT_253211 [Gonapodya prolifera JEL478]|uniref:Uncharacterized protein n=1 Tax=Gonapodya prolifera (strain JEL478) TaxID=1344416 RepID=A0A139ALF1_GONPJ|nr:hypothetical protein M427DRAFT_253211 [Gonapodya prolifera JEL478]|eukprot:KXS17528.1 hypothetical protein M427DRAFT_253211 [Gonapodya prolifera JEL478]